jgi:hypothetical protein
MSSLGNIPLSRVKLGRHLTPLRTKGMLMDGDQCYTWLLRQKNLLGWTYNYNDHCPLVARFKQLIVCIGPPRHNVRIANNVHLKCYMNSKSMLVTSFNLSYPSIIDLGVLVKDASLTSYMRLQFRKHWKSLE